MLLEEEKERKNFHRMEKIKFTFSRVCLKAPFKCSIKVDARGWEWQIEQKLLKI